MADLEEGKRNPEKKQKSEEKEKKKSKRTGLKHGIYFCFNSFQRKKSILKAMADLPFRRSGDRHPPENSNAYEILKSWKLTKRCSTMSETRLNGLAMTYIYRHIDHDVDTVLDEFAKSNRRLTF